MCLASPPPRLVLIRIDGVKGETLVARRAQMRAGVGVEELEEVPRESGEPEVKGAGIWPPSVLTSIVLLARDLAVAANAVVVSVQYLTADQSAHLTQLLHSKPAA